MSRSSYIKLYLRRPHHNNENDVFCSHSTNSSFQMVHLYVEYRLCWGELTFLGHFLPVSFGMLENLFNRQESDTRFSGEHWKICFLSRIREIGQTQNPTTTCRVSQVGFLGCIRRCGGETCPIIRVCFWLWSVGHISNGHIYSKYCMLYI